MIPQAFRVGWNPASKPRASGDDPDMLLDLEENPL